MCGGGAKFLRVLKIGQLGGVFPKNTHLVFGSNFTAEICLPRLLPDGPNNEYRYNRSNYERGHTTSTWVKIKSPASGKLAGLPLTWPLRSLNQDKQSDSAEENDITDRCLYDAPAASALKGFLFHSFD